jgi:hypothetical protein
MRSEQKPETGFEPGFIPEHFSHLVSNFREKYLSGKPAARQSPSDEARWRG